MKRGYEKGVMTYNLEFLPLAAPNVRVAGANSTIEGPWRDDGGEEAREFYVMECPEKGFIFSKNRPVDYKDVIEACTSEDLTHTFFIDGKKPRNLGKKHKDDLDEEGLACFHGVVIRPSGIYNVKGIMPSPEYPTGQIVTPISPKNFEVAKLVKESKPGEGYELLKPAA